MKFEDDWFGKDVNDTPEHIVSNAFIEIDNLLQEQYDKIMKRVKSDPQYDRKGSALVFILRQMDETIKECRSE